MLQDRVERRNGWDLQGADEVKDVLTVGAAPDSVLVLDRDHIDAVPEDPGGAFIVAPHFVLDPVMNILRVDEPRVGVMQDGNFMFARREG
jgi:hypothetical protein